MIPTRPVAAPPSLGLAAVVMAGLLTLPVLAQPLQLPGAQPLNPAGAQQSAPVGPAAPAGPPKPRAMPPVKVATEEAILGRALRHNGGEGNAVFERLGAGYGLRLTAEGYQSGNLTERCAVSFGESAVALTALGRPAGLARYRFEAPVCPIVFDVLDGAMLVSEPAEPCVIEAAACRIDTKGVWGPDVRTLVSRAKEIEQERGRAETAVREGFRILMSRAQGPDQRGIAREQAGFSSERELTCRSFLREGTLGFCGAKLTEARAASLRARIGGPEAGPEKPRPPRPRPPAPRPPAPEAAIR